MPMSFGLRSSVPIAGRFVVAQKRWPFVPTNSKSRSLERRKVRPNSRLAWKCSAQPYLFSCDGFMIDPPALNHFLLLLLANVDVRVSVVVENAEEAVDPDVDAGRLEERVVVRVDLDAPFLEQARNRAVGEDHGGRFYGRRMLHLSRP